jgi:alpha-tubulin suppressor-like RCC1 family protein
MGLSAGGFLHSCALMTFGGIYCWGNNDNGQLGTNDTTERLVPAPVKNLAQGDWLSRPVCWMVLDDQIDSAGN